MGKGNHCNLNELHINVCPLNILLIDALKVRKSWEHSLKESQGLEDQKEHFWERYWKAYAWSDYLKVILKNLENSFPNNTAAENKVITKQFYKFFSKV